MSAAAAAILDGMPDARDLHRLDSGGQIMIFAGPVLLFRYSETDKASRNLAVTSLRQLRFSGKAVAEATGLTPNYVATMYQAFLRDGTAALIRQPGRPRETGEESWDQAREWRAGGGRGAESARRLGVSQVTKPRGGEPQVTEPGAAAVRPAVVWSRYAGSMLLHAFFTRCAAGTVLAAAGDPREVRLLTGISMCFALGPATLEQFRHLAAAEAGPLAGSGKLPGLRALRPALSEIAGRTGSLELQTLFAAAMLAAGPVTSSVYYVDDHFIPYTGAKPAAKGRDSKRGRPGGGHAGTHVTAHDGRAVCFVSGEPSGLTVTLPKALAELKKAAGPGAKIMLGSGRGGAYPQVFTHCREEDVHWVTYRRAPLAVPAGLPVIAEVTIGTRTRELTWADETVQIKDYGDARQLTL